MMSLQSDLVINGSLFTESAIPQATADFNDRQVKTTLSVHRWDEVGAEKFRQMRHNNETPVPRPPLLENGEDTLVPSRAFGGSIPVRNFQPRDTVKGICSHMHGGGWILGSQHYHDKFLDLVSRKAGLLVMSVGYRLATEYPFPAGPQDCYDVAEYLVQNGQTEYGAPLVFIAGQSAGAHLAMLTLLHLHRKFPMWYLPGGMILHFGVFDLSSMMPSVHHYPRPLIIDHDIMKAFVKAFLPGSTAEERAVGAISPLYADWKTIAAEMKSRGSPRGLPRAFFAVGTEDPLLDDSIFMAAKWQMSGSEGILKVYPGAPPGFIVFDPKVLTSAAQGMEDLELFLDES